MAVQVDPIKPTLKPPGTKLLKLKCDTLLSTSAFKFNLRRFDKDADAAVQLYLRACEMLEARPDTGCLVH